MTKCQIGNRWRPNLLRLAPHHSPRRLSESEVDRKQQWQPVVCWMVVKPQLLGFMQCLAQPLGVPYWRTLSGMAKAGQQAVRWVLVRTLGELSQHLTHLTDKSVITQGKNDTAVTWYLNWEKPALWLEDSSSLSVAKVTASPQLPILSLVLVYLNGPLSS